MHQLSSVLSEELFPTVSCECPSFLEHFSSVLLSRTDVPASPVISLLQSWNEPFLQGVMAPFPGEWYSESRIWSLDVFTAVAVSVSQAFSVVRASEYMDVYTYIHSYIFRTGLKHRYRCVCHTLYLHIDNLSFISLIYHSYQYLYL